MDRADLLVYQYDMGTTQVDAGLGAVATFTLASENLQPEGIADPDEITDRVLMINVHGSSYDSDGYNIYQTLLIAGADATYVDLNLNGEVAAELSSHVSDYFDQLWVFDLSALSDNYPADWQAIASWYDAASAQEIICDARIISSYWKGRWQDEGTRLTKNYYENLLAQGGGLVLGTDHGVFQNGINSINSLIGLEPFAGAFSLNSIPVDTGSPLMTFPNDMGTHLADDSTPGQVPYGLQPNGHILYSVAWHSGNVDTPGIASTIEGAVGFHVNIVSPASGSAVRDGAAIMLRSNQRRHRPVYVHLEFGP